MCVHMDVLLGDDGGATPCRFEPKEFWAAIACACIVPHVYTHTPSLVGLSRVYLQLWSNTRCAHHELQVVPHGNHACPHRMAVPRAAHAQVDPNPDLGRKPAVVRQPMGCLSHVATANVPMWAPEYRSGNQQLWIISFLKLQGIGMCSTNGPVKGQLAGLIKS